MPTAPSILRTRARVASTLVARIVPPRSIAPPFAPSPAAWTPTRCLHISFIVVVVDDSGVFHREASLHQIRFQFFAFLLALLQKLQHFGGIRGIKRVCLP